MAGKAKEVLYTEEAAAFDDGTVIWLLHGYYKKKNKIPLTELNKALAIKRRMGL